MVDALRYDASEANDYTMKHLRLHSRHDHLDVRHHSQIIDWCWFLRAALVSAELRDSAAGYSLLLLLVLIEECSAYVVAAFSRRNNLCGLRYAMTHSSCFASPLSVPE